MTEGYKQVALPILGRLKRYDHFCSYDGGGPAEAEESADGEYVRYEDAVAEIAELQTGRDLYEVVRRMNVVQFKHVYVQSLYSSKPFDDFVAGMAPHFGLTVRK